MSQHMIEKFIKEYIDEHGKSHIMLIANSENEGLQFFCNCDIELMGKYLWILASQNEQSNIATGAQNALMNMVFNTMTTVPDFRDKMQRLIQHFDSESNDDLESKIIKNYKNLCQA